MNWLVERRQDVQGAVEDWLEAGGLCERARADGRLQMDP